MRRLLIAGMIAATLLVFGSRDSTPAVAAYPYDTWLYLYHPTGYQGVTQAKLTCGWHFGCNNSGLDADPLGLDWKWNSSTELSYLRVNVLVWESNNIVQVARVQKEYLNVGGCPFLRLTLQRLSDYGTIGTIYQSHTGSAGTTYWHLTGDASWENNERFTGNFINEQYDACSGYNHVMQYYSSGANQYYSFQNYNGFPLEPACNNWTNPGCAILKWPWGTPYEYLVKFWATQ